MDVIKSKRRQTDSKTKEVKTELDYNDILNIKRRKRADCWKNSIRYNDHINQLVDIRSVVLRLFSNNIAIVRNGKVVIRIANYDSSAKYLRKHKITRRLRNLPISNKSKKYLRKYYHGFQVYSIGTWTNSIIDDKNKEIYVFKTPMLYLELKKGNSYYPYKFMIVCINFNIECGGETLKNAEQCMCDRFNNIFKYIFNSGISNENIQAVENEMKQKNVWKEIFTELYYNSYKYRYDIENYFYKWQIK